MALVHSGESLFVIDVTNPMQPTLFGYLRFQYGSYTSLAEDAGRLYVLTANRGVYVLAKEKLTGLYLESSISGMGTLHMSSLVFVMMFVFILLTLSVFLWKRERRIAESKRDEFWIKSSTVNRTGILWAITPVLVVSFLLLLKLVDGVGLEILLPVCIIAPILFLLPRIARGRQRRRKQKVSAGTDQRTRLLGMIKAEKKLNMKTTSELTGLSEDRVKGLIYDLIGAGKIEGEFKGDDFTITSDVNAFIKDLESSFSQWEEQAKTGEAKKV